MQVYNDLDAVVSCPGDGFLEVRQLTRDVRLATLDIERPKADRNTDMVQSTARDNVGQRLQNIKHGHVQHTLQRRLQ